MVHGQHAEHIVLRLAAQQGNLVAVGHQIAVGKHSPLGVAGGAGGVDNHAGSMLVQMGGEARRLLQALLFGNEIFQLHLGEADIAAQLGQGIHQVQQLVGQQETGACVLDDVGDFPVGELEVDGDDDGAQAGDSHISTDEFRAVAGEKADTVTGLDADCVQPVTAVLHGLLQLLVSQAPLTIDDGYVIVCAPVYQFMYQHSGTLFSGIWKYSSPINFIMGRG